MGIKLATEKDIQWVNEQYQYIGFVPSSLDHEKVAIVTYDDKPAGMGRIVYLNEEEAEIGGIYILDEFRGLSLAYELVSYLVQETKADKLKKVYCLPFEELKEFYKKFGFRECAAKVEHINSKIWRKYQWCLSNYEKNVLLFELNLEEGNRL